MSPEVPKLFTLQSKPPYLRIEPGLTDIVAERFDASVRFGDQISKDMRAVRISPDVRIVDLRYFFLEQNELPFARRVPPRKLSARLSRYEFAVMKRS